MFIQQIINGLTIGTMYALCAAGYSMVFGILQFVNFAHGSVYMLGAFLTLTFVTTANLSFPIGFILSIIATGLWESSWTALRAIPLGARACLR